MKLAAVRGTPHLTYCTNIHPGETWEEVRANVERQVVAVKARVAPDRPFGVGLRLSARAADALADPREMDVLRGLLARERLYVFTVNGFPYGPFHGRPVKEHVYRPDWLEPERVRYTDRLATLLAEILPDDDAVEGSVSTVPGAFKARVTGGQDAAARMAELIVRHAATLFAIRERTGKRVSLALEPEPWCHLETVAETIAFFTEHLFSASARARFQRLTGAGVAASEAFLRHHLAVCFDACHAAVQFEEPERALQLLDSAGIRIAKVQLSTALAVDVPGPHAAALHALRRFADGVYLHQVVERHQGRLTRYVDLPEALDAANDTRASAGEWRIHFHVPVFLERLGPFGNTQEHLRRLLAVLRTRHVTSHLELETYTWEVLPAEYRGEDVVTSVAREMDWVLGILEP